MAMSSKQGISLIVGIAISIFVVAYVLPQSLGVLGGVGDMLINGTAFDTLVDPSIVTLLGVLLPLIVVVVIIMYYVNQVK